MKAKIALPKPIYWYQTFYRFLQLKFCFSSISSGFIFELAPEISFSNRNIEVGVAVWFLRWRVSILIGILFYRCRTSQLPEVDK